MKDMRKKLMRTTIVNDGNDCHSMKKKVNLKPLVSSSKSSASQAPSLLRLKLQAFWLSNSKTLAPNLHLRRERALSKFGVENIGFPGPVGSLTGCHVYGFDAIHIELTPHGVGESLQSVL